MDSFIDQEYNTDIAAEETLAEMQKAEAEKRKEEEELLETPIEKYTRLLEQRYPQLYATCLDQSSQKSLFAAINELSVSHY